MKLPSFTYLTGAFSYAFRRFPLTMLAAFTGVIAAISLIERSSGDTDNSFLIKLFFTAALGLPLFLNAHIIAEKWQLANVKKWLPALVAALLLLGYFMMMKVAKNDPGPVTMMQFVGLNLAAHLMVAFLPYLDQTPVDEFWEYNKRLFGNFMVGAFYSAVIFAGLSIAILAVDNLFKVDVDEKVYAYLFVVVAGVINTTFFLSNFPKEYTGLVSDEGHYVVAFKNLSKYILIPIVGIYFLILYAYSGKILATWELPQGWVGSLVLGFSIAGIFTYLLNYLLVKFDESALVNGYRRWFFYVLLPMVLLLFVAIGKRLGDYGVTEPRFFVAAAGAWLLLVSLYFIISKKDNIKFIPISLAVFVLLAVLGPLNAFRVSADSQSKRLQSTFEKHNMLAEGKAVPAKGTLPAEDADNIRSILYYLNDFGHLDKVASLFPGVGFSGFRDWSTVDSLIRSLNLDLQGPGAGPQCGFNFPRSTSLEIAGYERMVYVNLDDYADKTSDGWRLTESRTGLAYRESGAVVDTLDLQGYLQKMTAKYDCYNDGLDAADAEISMNTGSLEVKLILESVTFEKGQTKKVGNLSAVILTKQKK